MLKTTLFSATLAALFIGALVNFTNAQTTAAKTPALKTYVLGDGHFSIDMPGKPQKTNESGDGLSTDDYTVKIDKDEFVVTEMSLINGEPFDAEIAKIIKDTYFSSLSEGFRKHQAEGHDIEVGEAEEIAWNGLKGYQLIIEVEGKTISARVFIGERVYLMSSISEKPGFSEKVLNSFKIIEKKSK